MDRLLNVVKQFSDDIQMKFGLDKCKKLTIIRGIQTSEADTIFNDGDKITELNNIQSYKYLGIEENTTVKAKHMKAKLKTEYFSRIKRILKTKLNSKNIIKAINTFAVPSISYGFAILDWSVTELDIIDRETRSLLKKSHILHNQSNNIRLYLPRKEGGRDLLQICNQYKKATINLCRYIETTNERLLKLVRYWDQQQGTKSLKSKATTYCQSVNLNVNDVINSTKQKCKNTVNLSFIKHNITKLSDMKMHGQYNKELNQPYIDKQLSLAWLADARLKGPTEASIFAIQEQAITTKYIEKHQHKTSETDTCRVCNEYKETIHHVISGCPTLAPISYLRRHNELTKYIYLTLAEKFQLCTNEKWYSYKPNAVLQNDIAKLLWDFPIQTDHEIQHNKPDIILHEKAKNTAYIIDIAVPSDYNIVNKRAEKLRNYVDLAIELKELWNLDQVKIIPIIIGATGLIHTKFEDDVKRLNIKINIREAQKITLLGTARIVRTFFQMT